MIFWVVGGGSEDKAHVPRAQMQQHGRPHRVVQTQADLMGRFEQVPLRCQGGREPSGNIRIMSFIDQDPEIFNLD